MICCGQVLHIIFLSLTDALNISDMRARWMSKNWTSWQVSSVWTRPADSQDLNACSIHTLRAYQAQASAPQRRQPWQGCAAEQLHHIGHPTLAKELPDHLCQRHLHRLRVWQVMQGAAHNGPLFAGRQFCPDCLKDLMHSSLRLKPEFA